MKLRHGRDLTCQSRTSDQDPPASVTQARSYKCLPVFQRDFSLLKGLFLHASGVLDRLADTRWNVLQIVIGMRGPASHDIVVLELPAPFGALLAELGTQAAYQTITRKAPSAPQKLCSLLVSSENVNIGNRDFLVTWDVSNGSKRLNCGDVVPERYSVWGARMVKARC